MMSTWQSSLLDCEIRSQEWRPPNRYYQMPRSKENMSEFFSRSLLWPWEFVWIGTFAIRNVEMVAFQPVALICISCVSTAHCSLSSRSLMLILSGYALQQSPGANLQLGKTIIFFLYVNIIKVKSLVTESVSPESVTRSHIELFWTSCVQMAALIEQVLYCGSIFLGGVKCCKPN